MGKKELGPVSIGLMNSMLSRKRGGTVRGNGTRRERDKSEQQILDKTGQVMFRRDLNFRTGISVAQSGCAILSRQDRAGLGAHVPCLSSRAALSPVCAYSVYFSSFYVIIDGNEHKGPGIQRFLT